MNQNKIRELLLLGENQRIVYKASAKSSLAGRDVCGFLNSGGGYVVCGVEGNGDITGVDNDGLATLEKQIHEKLSPKALVSVEMRTLEGKPVFVLEVPAGKDLPYAFHDTIYIRSGSTTKKADIDTIRDMVMRQQIKPERWERRSSLAELDSELDQGEVSATVRDAQKVHRAFFRNADNLVDVLEDLAMARYGRLTQGGDVLFTRNPALRYPQTRVRAICYQSDKTGDTFSDMKSIEGPLHWVFEQAFAFIVRNTQTRAHFRKGTPQREDIPLYPEFAVREALINAFAHRDYTSPSGGIVIHIYPHRMEIWNSGSLPDGVTVETLSKGHISVLRNPDIAHVLYLRGLMEKAGRGSMQIIKACREAGLPAPTWVSGENLGVTITFTAPQATHQATPQATHQATPQALRLITLLDHEMSATELMEALHIKDRKHFRDAFLQPSLDGNFVEMTIPEKPSSPLQKYRLTETGRIALGKSRASE